MRRSAPTFRQRAISLGPRHAAGVVLALIVLASSAEAQVSPPPSPGQDSVTVVPGEIYEASGLYRALVGSGYRDLWTTPIRVPVADMGALGGGLTPVELGGGTTTQTLQLDGADGRRYVFRSVQKSPRDLLEDLEGTPAGAIIQDQMSAFHPSGAMVTARLLEAVDVLHPEPRLMVVPDDPRLGEFREQFAGMLVLFEERPDDLPEGEAGFAGSTRIVQTDELFDEMEQSALNRVELRELLRVRLVDLLVGDRDRSVNNHLWARFDDGEGYLWRPIPRDRDQSFVQFDGLLKIAARQVDFRLVPFRAEYSNTRAVTRNAWDIDRSFLVALDRATWDAAVDEVRAAVTDEVIRDAVSRMPPEHYAVVGQELESALFARRDALPGAAAEFYEIVFEYADVYATDEDEIAILEGIGSGGVRVSLARRSDGGAPEAPYFDRTFVPDETREIRVYLRGGDDSVQVRGGEFGPRVRILGGGGADAIVNGGGADVTFYDDGEQTVVEGPGVRRVRESPPRPFAWFEESYELDWGSYTYFRPGMSYDSDRGLVPIVGFQHVRHGFGRLPDAYRFQARGGWAFSHAKPILQGSLFARDFVGEADLNLEALYSGIEVVNFFGFGNDTPAEAPDAFYKVDQEQLVIGASLAFGDEEGRVDFGPVFKRVVSDTSGVPNRLAEVRPFGTGELSEVGVRSNVHWDGTDLPVSPTRGMRADAGIEYYPALLDLDEPFGLLHGEIAAFLSLPGGNPTLAARIGGRKLWGDHPYFEAALLGGGENLRGLHEERFAGDASVFGSAELRVFLARLTFLAPMDLGALAFVDRGRVYLEGETSSEWHDGRGGGLWFAPLNRSTTVRLTLASAEGHTAFYAGMGFAF